MTHRMGSSQAGGELSGNRILANQAWSAVEAIVVRNQNWIKRLKPERAGKRRYFTKKLQSIIV